MAARPPTADGTVAGGEHGSIDACLQRRDGGQDERRRAMQLLVWLHDRHWWLSCGCHGDIDRPPIWFPVARAGTYFLSSRGSTPHASTCPRRHADRSMPLTAPPTEPVPSRPWEGGWLLHPTTPAETVARVDDAARLRGQHRPPSL